MYSEKHILSMFWGWICEKFKHIRASDWKTLHCTCKRNALDEELENYKNGILILIWKDQTIVTCSNKYI